MLVDNGGHAGAQTPLTLPVIADLTVQNGAKVAPAVGTVVRNLQVAANGTLSSVSDIPLNLTVQGNATIANGGAIVMSMAWAMADGAGPGAGTYTMALVWAPAAAMGAMAVMA